MAFSKNNAVLAAQASNFSTVLAANPVVYGETAGVATTVTTVVDAFIDAQDTLTEARANGVRSEQMTALRDSMRLAMLDVLRPIYASVQQSMTISDAAKIALGVHIRDTHNTPQPVPGVTSLSVTKVDGSVFTLRVSDPTEPTRKARPPYTAGISVFSYVGEEPPTEATAFKFEGNTGRTTINVEMPASAPTGATVWFTCFYFNNRKESGPACTPISATIGAGSTIPMAA